MEISINDLNTFQLPSNCFSSHYKILCFLGEGSYGSVFKAREISTGRVVAVKKMLIGDSPSKYKKTIKEINLLKKLDHPNIVKYYDYFEDEENIYIIMEYLEGCTLKQYIKKNETILEDNARIIIKQLLTALSYLHYTCDICHRDIKPENIMFRDKNDINNLKLLDFGLSLDRFESKNYLENCGTLVYMAPELFSHNVKYTKGVDVWSVGIILYMLLMKGKNPFYNKEDKRETVIKNIKNNNVSFPNDNTDIYQISKMGKDLISKLLKKNPVYRYTIRSALEHPWITLKKFDKIPLTIYDKANIDENVERLKILLFFSIFLNYVKNNRNILEINETEKNLSLLNNKKYLNNSKNLSEADNFSFDLGLEANHKNKKFKSSKQIKNKPFFDMEEYEKKVKYSNDFYHLKFLQDREIMFNPKLSIKKNSNNNNNVLSNIFKRLKENKSKEETSLDFIENSEIKMSHNSLNMFQKNSSSKKLLFNDEQKNPDMIDISKIKTPFKLRNNFLESSKTIITKSKLNRKFSAMPKIIKNPYNNPKMNKDEIIINKKISKEQNISSIHNMKNFNVNKNSNMNQNLIKFKNDIKFFEKQLEKRRSIRTNSAKNVNIYLHHIDRSMNMNDKNRKWHLAFKKQNLINNKYIFYNKGNKPNKNMNQNINDVKIVSYNNKEKEKEKINIKLKNKQNIILSITEHSQNDVFCQKRKIFPVIM